MEVNEESVLVPGTFNPLSKEVTEYLVSSCNYEEANTNGCDGRFSDGKDLHLLSLPPRFTTIRVNLSRKTINEAKVLIEEEMRNQFKGHSYIPVVYRHHTLHDLLVIETCGMQSVTPVEKEVVLGKICGSAVLRGAEVYAPGVLAVTPGLMIGDDVAMYVDLNGKCLRGSKKFDGRKLFVGNGILMQTRKDLFNKEKPSGLAVSKNDQIFDSPSLGCFYLDFLFLQNLPSVLCSHILGVGENEVVLDMCASPGGKATHIASLMNGTGCVIAIDRSQNKLDQINQNAERLGLKNIITLKYDSTTLLNEIKSNEHKLGSESIKEDDYINQTVENSYRLTQKVSPPYKPSSFKKILLDAPCSALGQRPQLQTKTDLKALQSFPVIQRKLLSTGMKLLAPGGKLVYSTCTIAPQENEEMVKWVLDNFTDIELVDTQPKLGMPGLPKCGLHADQCNKVQRFGPRLELETDVDKDTIGFFIASFSKKECL